MTEKELSGLFYLNRETEWLQKDLEKLEHSIGAKSPVLSHSPKGKGQRGISDLAVEIADLKAVIQLNLIRIQRERARLERYINSIDDPEIRLIFRLRHINGMTWREIGEEVYMSHMSAFNKHKSHLKNLQNLQEYVVL